MPSLQKTATTYNAYKSNTSASEGWNPTGSVSGPNAGAANVGKSYSSSVSDDTVNYHSILFRGFLQFDTSAIPDGATIQSVSIQLTGTLVHDFTAYYCDQSDPLTWDSSVGVVAFDRNGGSLSNANYVNKTGPTTFILIAPNESTQRTYDFAVSSVSGAVLTVNYLTGGGGNVSANPDVPTIISPAASSVQNVTFTLQGSYSTTDTDLPPGFVRFTLNKSGGGTSTFVGSTVTPGQVSQVTIPGGSALTTGSYTVTAQAVDVRGNTSNVTSPVSFTVAVVAGSPTSPSPNNQSVGSLTPVLQAVYTHAGSKNGEYAEWEIYAADGINRIWTSGKVKWVPNFAPNATVTQSVPTGLLAFGTTYKWRVRFWDVDGNPSPWLTPLATFTVNHVPGAPTVSGLPAGNAIYGFPTSFLITFSDPDNAATMSKYRFILVSAADASTPNLAEIVQDTTVTTSAVTSATANIVSGTLQWGTQYFLLVKTWDQYGAEGPFCAPIAVYTNDYPVATPVTPAGSVGSPTEVSSSSPVLTFSISDRFTQTPASMTATVNVYNNGTNALAYTNTFSVSGAGHSHQVSGSLAGSTTYRWEVRVSDGLLTGAYSALAYFHVGAGPAVAVTAPTYSLVSPQDASEVLVTWTYSGGTGAQTAYRVVLLRVSDGHVFYNSGQISDPGGTARGFIIPAGYLPYDPTTVFGVYVEATDSSPITSRSGVSQFVVAFPTVSPVGAASVSTDEARHRHEVSWTETSTNAANFAGYLVLRKIVSDLAPAGDPEWPQVERYDVDAWYVVGRVDQKSTLSFHDYLVASGVRYRYAVAVVGRVNGWGQTGYSARAETDEATLVHDEYSMLASAVDPRNYRMRGLFNPKHQIQDQSEFRDFLPFNRAKPLRIVSLADYQKRTFSFQYHSDDRPQTVDMLRKLKSLNHLLYFCDSRGTELFCLIDGVQENYVAPKLHEASFNLTEQASPFTAHSAFGVVV